MVKVRDLHAAQALQQALRAKRPSQSEWMARIKKKIDGLASGGKGKDKDMPQRQTWAQVAAQQATRLETTCQPQKHTVRICMPVAQGRTPEEILQVVKPVIKGAYAIRALRSGNVDVLVPSQGDRNPERGRRHKNHQAGLPSRGR